MNWRKLIPLLLVPALAGLFYTFQRMDNTIVESPQGPVELPRYTLGDAELTRFDSDGNIILTG